MLERKFIDLINKNKGSSKIGDQFFYDQKYISILKMSISHNQSISRRVITSLVKIKSMSSFFFFIKNTLKHII
jgi:hypothetical protein